MEEHKHKRIYDLVADEELCNECGQVLSQDYQEPDVSKPDRALYYVVQSSFSSADYSLNGLMSGQIDGSNLDCRGKRIKNREMINRIRFVDRFIAKKDSIGRDRAYRNAMWVITTLCEKLKLSGAVKERSAQIYKTAYLKKAVRGRSTLGIASAAVYLACKELGVKRNHSEFMSILDDQSDWRKNLFINYRTLIYFLEMEAPPASNPVSEMPAISSRCGMSEKCLRIAQTIYSKIRKFDQTVFYGKSPSAIATCILYLASKKAGEEIKHDDIVKAGNISGVTLRKRCIEYTDILKKINTK